MPEQSDTIEDLLPQVTNDFDIVEEEELASKLLPYETKERMYLVIRSLKKGSKTVVSLTKFLSY